MRFYTWKDVERYLLLHRNSWEEVIDSIEVYPSDIVVHAKEENQSVVSSIMQKLFGTTYDVQKKAIKLDMGNTLIPIDVQEPDMWSHKKTVLPLFSNIIYQTSSYPEKTPEALSRPVFAFHSYKGGVGRTLSLISFAKAWSTLFEADASNRILIVDSDIEAPGMTWLHHESTEDVFSYFDLLTLIQDNRSIEEIVDLACSKLKLSTITIETPTRKIDHVFIPTYRYEEQLIDLYATPETLVNHKGKEYALATVLSKICERMGLCAALVDLRAGISEHSSTLLLDPRVKKYLVTSTSTQSIKGTKILLKYILKGLGIGENTILPEIFLNMVPDTLSDNEKDSIIEELLQCYEQEVSGDDSFRFTDNAITELPFASELIHLTSMQQILDNLNGRGLYFKLEKLIKQNYKEETSTSLQGFSDNDRNNILEQINAVASSQLTAEANANFDVLMTASLKYLSRKYHDSIPTTVVMGAKGSGKTFLYRKMIESRDWKLFCENLDEDLEDTARGCFLPVIATKNSAGIIHTLKACIKSFNSQIPCASVSESVFLDNVEKIECQKGQTTDWLHFWQVLLSSSINPQYTNLNEINRYLEMSEKKVVFLIDGLEDVFTHISTSENEQTAVRVLCQDIVAQLIARYPNIGIIVYLRRDMAQSSIKVNFKQFEQANGQAELKWSSNDALRLVVWLVAKACPQLYKRPDEIDRVSQTVIDETLVRLWGIKLGKPSSNEAYSSRWILAALSDFNGQLQARDIIRFLKYASASPKKMTYTDRIIMPAELRTAVSTCSYEKIDEVKQEYYALRPIFEKLENLPEDQKILPLLPQHANLSGDEERRMLQEGYLKRDGDKLYLPEIIRHALGFKYEKGARPKVLALTLK